MYKNLKKTISLGLIRVLQATIIAVNICNWCGECVKQLNIYIKAYVYKFAATKGDSVK